MRESKERFKIGQFFFKHRGVIPIPFVIAVALMVRHSYPYGKGLDSMLEIIGLIVVLCGELLRVMAVGDAPTGTSGRGNKIKANVLRTTGLYAYSRNPIYLANFFMGLGFSIFVGRIWVVGVYIIFFATEYALIIKAESEFLAQKFGQKFDKWKRYVPAFFPTFEANPYKKKRPQDEFSFRRALRREHDTTALFLLALIGWEIWETLAIDGYSAAKAKIQGLIIGAVLILTGWFIVKGWKRRWFLSR